MRIVITQSMLFPWVGMLEQIRLADVVVHYDDVQFSKGSFVNRVQLKTAAGLRWMTVPLRDVHLGQTIDAVRAAPAATWRDGLLDLLARATAGAPHAADAVALARTVLGAEYAGVGALARASLRALVDYFGLGVGKRFIDVAELGVAGHGSDRVLAIVQQLGGDEYITGHGARHYLDHERFERAGIAVGYLDYRCVPYPQQHGAFHPYVSALDLVANCGAAGERFICSPTVPWRDFLASRAEASS